MVEGSYSYLTPEGDEVEVAYTANENGYFPTVSASIDSFFINIIINIINIIDNPLYMELANSDSGGPHPHLSKS